MERADVARWLDAYVEAWQSYDRELILALFADRVSYRYHPYDEPLVGSDAIADDWLDDRDEPGGWTATYEPIAVDGDTAIAVGSSTYTHPDGSIRTIYDNCFVIRFDEHGRCIDFVEWFMERPGGTDA